MMRWESIMMMMSTGTTKPLTFRPRTQCWIQAPGTSGTEPSAILARLQETRRLIDALDFVPDGTEAHRALLEHVCRELMAARQYLACLKT